MQPHTQSRYDFTPVSCGPDWITATAKRGSPSLEFETLADEILQKKRDAGGAILSASRFGYQGHSTKGFFFGRRKEDSCIVASGPDTPARVRPIIEAASNVSRLDLQVTVWTHGEQPHLAMESYQRLRSQRHRAHRSGQVTLITTDPIGETLNVNKRTSDYYGRIYDKASESKIGPARTLWRYEVELKRRPANSYARALAGHASMADFTKSAVTSWFERKGVELSYNIKESPVHPEIELPVNDTDVLTWFERSLSITVARAIKAHGLRVTLAALGLEALVAPITKGDTHAR